MKLLDAMFSRLRTMAVIALVPLLATPTSYAWGVDGPHMINRLAGMNLPGDIPAFLRTPEALDALEYYAPEPDHWRGRGEPIELRDIIYTAWIRSADPVPPRVSRPAEKP